MKLSARQVETFLSRPDPAITAALFYGPDRGLAAERITRLLQAAGVNPEDPLAVTRLEAAVVEREPARLAEEAQTPSLFSGQRAIIIRGADERALRAATLLLELPEPASLVIFEAGDLGPQSKLRQLFEHAARAVAIACYREEGAPLQRSLLALLQAHGLDATPDVLAELGSLLGADRGITRNEIEKLALYIGDRSDRRVQPADIAAVIADAAHFDVEALVDALLLGQPRAVARLLDRLFAQGEEAVALLRRTAFELKRLLSLIATCEQGQTAAQVVANARPPIFFRRQPVFEMAVRRWSGRAVLDALAALEAAETACKTTGMPEQLICRQQLLELAAAAAAFAPSRSA